MHYIVFVAAQESQHYHLENVADCILSELLVILVHEPEKIDADIFHGNVDVLFGLPRTFEINYARRFFEIFHYFHLHLHLFHLYFIHLCFLEHFNCDDFVSVFAFAEANCRV